MKFRVTHRERISVEHYQHDRDGRELPDTTGRTYFRVQLAPMKPSDDHPWRAGYVGLELTPAEAQRFELGSTWELSPALPDGAKPAGEA